MYFTNRSNLLNEPSLNLMIFDKKYKKKDIIVRYNSIVRNEKIKAIDTSIQFTDNIWETMI